VIYNDRPNRVNVNQESVDIETRVSGDYFKMAACGQNSYHKKNAGTVVILNKAAARELRAELDAFLTETFEVGDMVEMLEDWDTDIREGMLGKVTGFLHAGDNSVSVRFPGFGTDDIWFLPSSIVTKVVL
jgi:hypothetical protein